MANPTPLEKGNALEDAVRAIETAILRSFPGYSESAFRIEGKKVVAVNGVRDEIDVNVTASLGATGQDVVRLFLGRGLAIVAIGLAVGTIAAVVGSSALSTLLFGVDRLDLSVYGLAITTLAVVAGVAIWLPARQAATTQPGIILRD